MCVCVYTLNFFNYANWLKAKDSGPEKKKNRQKLKVSVLTQIKIRTERDMISSFHYLWNVSVLKMEWIKIIRFFIDKTRLRISVSRIKEKHLLLIGRESLFLPILVQLL